MRSAEADRSVPGRPLAPEHHLAGPLHDVVIGPEPFGPVLQGRDGFRHRPARLFEYPQLSWAAVDTGSSTSTSTPEARTVLSGINRLLTAVPPTWPARPPATDTAITCHTHMPESGPEGRQQRPTPPLTRPTKHRGWGARDAHVLSVPYVVLKIQLRTYKGKGTWAIEIEVGVYV